MINEKVNGKTEVFAVIGDPVEHSSSPVIQNTFAQISEKNMIYTAMRVKPEGLKKAVEGAYELGIRGINVTVPHKKEVMKYLCAIDPNAEKIGAVNTLKYTEKGYVGYNTDIYGIDYTLKEANQNVKGKKVLLLGAGGAACAAAVFALSENCEELVIANRTEENAVRLKERMEKYFSGKITALTLKQAENIKDCRIVFNATTVGFGDKTGLSPIENINFFKENNIDFVFDIIYTPWETQLLKDAAKFGITNTNGFSMLVYQAAAAQEIWFDEKIPWDTKIQLKNELANYYRR